MTLYLVQHGDALGKAQDPERPLSDKGRRDVQTMASFLSESGVRPRRVIHSGKTRATQTAQFLSDIIGPDGEVEESDVGLAPNDPTEPLKNQIENGDEDVMIVGHLPFMGRLVSHLVTGSPEAETVSFEPGTVACLNKDEEGNWTVHWMVRPSLLGEAR
jgi:phosphohistidine phosphatase